MLFKESCHHFVVHEHVFFCEHLCDPNSGAVKQLHGNVKCNSPKEKLIGESMARKKSTKGKECKDYSTVMRKYESQKSCLGLLINLLVVSLLGTNNYNVFFSAIELACGNEDDCMRKKLNETVINDIHVDFINWASSCQGILRMNRSNKSAWRKVQYEMILAFLSFANYFWPIYFLSENVINHVIHQRPDIPVSPSFTSGDRLSSEYSGSWSLWCFLIA
ncbi:hypothetical protein Cgig2_006648 [Carnegiea gigantea]|uniref:Uncharacterized protein n=1 Tax=Carnegiea gigantea TaxID=171969 RepID=A0A9Q1GYR0_9CARY|nr:hypothetical protein Cgig2_006648 [Carnegiea gigantea]